MENIIYILWWFGVCYVLYKKKLNNYFLRLIEWEIEWEKLFWYIFSYVMNVLFLEFILFFLNLRYVFKCLLCFY